MKKEEQRLKGEALEKQQEGLVTHREVFLPPQRGNSKRIYTGVAWGEERAYGNDNP